jgi:hypothetical protein
MPFENMRPRAGKIPAAIKRSGIARSSLYKLRAKYPELFRKLGSATLIDFDVLDRVIDELPIAEIKETPNANAAPTGGRRSHLGRRVRDGGR